MQIFEYQNDGNLPVVHNILHDLCHLIYTFLASKRPFGIIVKSSLKIVVHVSFYCEIFTDSFKVKQKYSLYC